MDTLGAGDIFHGAFCYQTMCGASFTDAAEICCRSSRALVPIVWDESVDGIVESDEKVRLSSEECATSIP